MEELKILVESIAGLPDLAIWVVAMYFFFKIVVVGSIYGVIRYVTLKITETIKSKKINVVENVTIEEKNTYTLESKMITTGDNTATLMKDFLNEIKSTSYVHQGDMEYVFKALAYYKQNGGSRLKQPKDHKDD